MAGHFPEGREFNVCRDAQASIVVAEQWPTEIILSGFEIGNKVLTGKRLVKMNIQNSPVKDAYEVSFAEGDPDGRMSWDQTAVLVAAKGIEPFYTTERGTMHVDQEGRNTWAPGEKGNHIKLVEKMPPSEVAYIIENYMMHQPK